MTRICRIWAALTISVVAGLTAGCASSTVAPTVAAAKTPIAGKTAYCAPLAVAYKTKPAQRQVVTVEILKNFGKLLEPAAAAASVAGKTDVAELLSLMSKMDSDPLHITAAQARTARAALEKVGPLIVADCDINLLK